MAPPAVAFCLCPRWKKLDVTRFFPLILALLLSIAPVAEAGWWSRVCGLVWQSAAAPTPEELLKLRLQAAEAQVRSLFPHAREVDLLEASYMSTVYQVMDAQGNSFAVKVSNEPGAFGEARLALEHNLLRYFSEKSPRILKPSRYEAKGMPTMVTPLYELGPMNRLLPIYFGPQAEFKVLHRAMLDGVEALSAIHAEGWVHNDVKPENFVVDVVEGALRLILLDFGLAAQIGSWPSGSGPHATVARGTPGYQDMVQARNWASHPESDLFALSITFQEMLLGHKLKDSERFQSPHGNVAAINPYLSAISFHSFEKASDMTEMLGHAKTAMETGDPSAFYKPYGKLLQTYRTVPGARAQHIALLVRCAPELYFHFSKLELGEPLESQVRHHYTRDTRALLP